MASRMAELMARYGDKPKKKVKKKAVTGSGIRIVDAEQALNTSVKAKEEEDDDEPVIANLEEFNEAERRLREARNKQERLERMRQNWQSVGSVVKKEEPRSDDDQEEQCALPKHRGTANRDLSPPRARRHDTPSPEKDLSPPRRRRHDTPSPEKDLSPPRRKRHDSPAPGQDLSPPRRRRHDTPSPEKETRKGGLVTAEDLHREHEEQAARKRARPAEDDELTGRNAKTVYRRGGKRYDPREEEAAKEKEKKPYEPTAEQMEWGKGLVQKAQSDLERDEMISSLKEKFSRGQDDAELDSRLRAAQHWDDPMRHLLGQDQLDDDPLMGMKKLSKKEKKKRDKAWVQQEVRRRMRYRGPFQPNRFGIYPGRRWDAVDRGNGYEHKFFLAKAKANEEKKKNFATENEGL